MAARKKSSKGKKKFTYNVKGVESAGGDFEVAPVGLYRAEVVAFDWEPVGHPGNKTENDRWHVQLKITHDSKGKKVKKNYGYLHRYLPEAVDEDSPAAPFVRQFLEAIGALTGKKAEEGDLDPDKLVGNAVLVRVRHETWTEAQGGDGSVRARIGNIMPLSEEEDDDDEDDDEDDDDEVEEEEEDDDDEEDDEDEDEDDEDSEESEDEDEDDEDEDEDEEEEQDWSEMSLADLKEAVKEYDGTLTEILGKGKRAKKGAKAKAALVEWLEENAEDVDYNDWTVPELKEELEGRGESTKGKKTELVKRLEKLDEDEEAESPF